MLPEFRTSPRIASAIRSRRDVLEQTNDLQAVQKLLGHRQLTTTQNYARVVDRRRRAAVESLPSFPVHQPDSLIPSPPGRDDG
jgi:integrase